METLLGLSSFSDDSAVIKHKSIVDCRLCVLCIVFVLCVLHIKTVFGVCCVFVLFSASACPYHYTRSLGRFPAILIKSNKLHLIQCPMTGSTKHMLRIYIVPANLQRMTAPGWEYLRLNTILNAVYD